MICKYCQHPCVRKGYAKHVQRYRCNGCNRYQQACYSKPRIPLNKYKWVVKLNNEGCGISSIARLLSVSKSSVQRLIERMAATLTKPARREVHQRYEVDELRTFCGSKQNELWVMYIINRSSKRIVNVVVGRRTKENLSLLLATALALQPKRIYSDRLGLYAHLIPAGIHRTQLRCTNYIDRKNLTLRTHLKRLSRKTLCFTKSARMLYYCLQLYSLSTH